MFKITLNFTINFIIKLYDIFAPTGVPKIIKNEKNIEKTPFRRVAQKKV